MSLQSAFCSYYGRLLGRKPLRSLSQDLVTQRKQEMLEEMKEMEERLKRHVTECKREIIKEFLGIKSKKDELKKGEKDGKKSTDNE